MFRCAILGCGPRATAHAKAYAHIKRGQLVAICDLNPERLHAFGDEYGVSARYTDAQEMLAREKPDVVHIVTQPTIRVPLMQMTADAGVPGVIVEKPICIGADDYKALRQLDAASSTRFVVNHQLRHHPRVLDLLATVQEGGIGEVRFIDASCGLPLAGQGVHSLDLIFAFNGYAGARAVFAASSGYDDINGAHPSPRSSVTFISFENGTRAILQAGADAPRYTPSGPSWMNKRIAVYGTAGFVHWRMDGWERWTAEGGMETGRHEYRAEDVLGQAALTEALFDWLQDDARVHPNRLSISLDQWLVILAHYASTVEGCLVELPFDPPDDLLDQLKAALGAPASPQLS